jgi:hypothetical protein
MGQALQRPRPGRVDRPQGTWQSLEAERRTTGRPRRDRGAGLNPGGGRRRQMASDRPRRLGLGRVPHFPQRGDDEPGVEGAWLREDLRPSAPSGPERSRAGCF